MLPLYTIKRGKCTCAKGAACTHPGKHPRTHNGVKDGTTDRDPPLIDQLDEFFYATIPDSRKCSKPARARKERIAWLRKKYKDDLQSLALADKLEGCIRGDRCKSAACPECSDAARRLVVEVARPFLKKQISEDTIVVCVSVVPADSTSELDQLSLGQHQRNVQRWKEILARAGIAWFIGASDWSANEHKQQRYAPHWSHHFYGFTVTDDVDKLKQRLGEQFPTTDAIPRPVKVQAWDGKGRAIRYMVKSDFKRRIGIDDGKRFNKADGTQRSCRATDKQPLRSSQKRELLLHLDQIGLDGRLMLLPPDCRLEACGSDCATTISMADRRQLT